MLWPSSSIPCRNSAVKIGFLVGLLVLVLPAASDARELVAVRGGAMTYTLVEDDEEVVHDIWVDDFQIAATELTVGEWRRFTEDSGMEFCWEGHYCGDIAELSPGENCPIQLVRIAEAALYCNWLSAREGLTPVYYREDGRILRNPDADGYRLPTTEEWDYAARGGRRSRGYRFSGSDNPDEVAWYGLSWEDGTRPVGSLKANELGLHDMSGNIREWTWPEGGIPIPEIRTDDVVQLRGGGWISDLVGLELRYTQIAYPSTWNVNGFRLARNADTILR